MIWHTKLKRYKRSFRTDAWSKSSGQQGRGSRSQFLRIQSFIGNKNTFITTYLTMGSNVRYKRCETIWWWSYLVGSSWWTKVILVYHRGFTSYRWSFRPNSAWGSKETTTIGQTHPTLRANNNLNISIPCAAPSTPSKSLVGYKRARNSREKEVEDRTYPHLDHVDNPRQTTHAVGVLKAVKIGRHFSG